MSPCNRHLLSLDMHREMHVDLCSTAYCRPIITDVEMCRQNLAELANLQFHVIFVERFQLLHTYGRRHTAVNWATFETFHCKHSQLEKSPLERIQSDLQLPSILIRLHMAIQVYKFDVGRSVHHHSYIHLVVCLTTGPKPLPK